jgi:hypothetical protein
MQLLCDFDAKKAEAARLRKLSKRINEWLSSDSLLPKLDKHIKDNPKDMEFVLTQIVKSRSDAGFK